MSDVRIAFIGAGSYVFGPGILNALTFEHALDGVELALMDVDAEMLAGMAGVGRRMAREAGVALRIEEHTDRASALDGADFVITAAAPGLAERFAMDVALIHEHLPGHLVTEFGGVAGISYSLRQIAFFESIVADMKQRCPDAWLLNASNPLPRVCTATSRMGIRTAGFCSASLEGYAMLWRLLHDEPLAYPYGPATDWYDVTMGGVNHFCWVTRMRKRQTGEDLLDSLRQRLADGGTTGWPASDDMGRRCGWVMVPNDHHTLEFLPPGPHSHSRQSSGHGGPQARQRRCQTLRAVAEGELPLDRVTRQVSWEKPVDMIAGIAFGRRTSLHSLNLPNEGQIPQLPAGTYVESACDFVDARPVPRRVDLPQEPAALCRQAIDLTEAIVTAALQRRLDRVHDAVELDPTILDKAAGKAAVDRAIALHADVLPAYA